MEELIKELKEIQKELKAPKDLTNKFGGYKYRSCESILESLKPLLDKRKITLVISDEIVNIGDRYYVKATATLTNGKDTLSNTAYAREDLEKKGMDSSQLTGSTSSYARKYALNGLFLIDDTKDSDNANPEDTEEEQKEKAMLMIELSKLIEEKGADREKVLTYYKVHSDREMTVEQLRQAVNSLKGSKK